MSATEVHRPSRDAAAGKVDMNCMSVHRPTLTIDAPNGTTYAYRRFGRKGAPGGNLALERTVARGEQRHERA